jgi:hypothetical protein
MLDAPDTNRKPPPLPLPSSSGGTEARRTRFQGS